MLDGGLEEALLEARSRTPYGKHRLGVHLNDSRGDTEDPKVNNEQGNLEGG